MGYLDFAVTVSGRQGKYSVAGLLAGWGDPGARIARGGRQSDMAARIDVSVPTIVKIVVLFSTLLSL